MLADAALIIRTGASDSGADDDDDDDDDESSKDNRWQRINATVNDDNVDVDDVVVVKARWTAADACSE